MAKFNPTKLFLTSFPNGELRPVEVIKEYEDKKGLLKMKLPEGPMAVLAKIEIVDDLGETVTNWKAISDIEFQSCTYKGL